MITAKKDGREIRAMVMSEPIDHCRGVVQCALSGCEAWMPIVEPGSLRPGPDGDTVEDLDLNDQVRWFLDHHECRAAPRGIEA